MCITIGCTNTSQMYNHFFLKNLFSHHRLRKVGATLNCTHSFQILAYLLWVPLHPIIFLQQIVQFWGQWAQWAQTTRCDFYGIFFYKSFFIVSHLQNKWFTLNFKFQRNASKFAIFWWKENPHSFFHSSFLATFIFHLWIPWSMWS